MPFAIIAPYRAPYRLSRRDGWATTFSDRAELGAVLRAIGIILSSDPVDGLWCAFDNDGVLLPHEAVCPEAHYPRHPRFRSRHRKQASRAAELGIAIPGTGKRSGGHGFRRPRNLGVHRAKAAEIVDLEGLKMGRLRTGHCPPSDHDDVHRSHSGHNWKLTRRTRWRQSA